MPTHLNRLVAFAGPYISIAAGVVATWLIAKANALGIPGLDESDLAQQIAAALTFSLAAILTWLGSAQWLKGHHVQMAADAAIQAAALAVAAPAALTPPADPELDELIALGEDLPTDEEEFAMPPDAEARLAPEVPA
jgi:hypothetical protein